MPQDRVHKALGSPNPEEGLVRESVAALSNMRLPNDVRLSYAGWDKIFYFMGANTFSKKFCPKHRESDAKEGVQNSNNLGIKYVFYKFIFS